MRIKGSMLAFLILRYGAEADHLDRRKYGTSFLSKLCEILGMDTVA